MADADFFRPTLLVGVGGTGCLVAERVFLEARRNNASQKERIGALVFDTDLSALQKLKSVPEDGRVQISAPEPVSRILQDNPDAKAEWFFEGKDLSQPLLNMSLLQGAGQIRMMTRLALHDSFRRGRSIAKSRAAIAKIAANDGKTTFSGVINILIVGSLAGATGSGSFYQVALMLREVCRQSNITANIMGLFLLPDVYIRPGKILVDQIENVKVNAYAALKELNAINVMTTQADQGESFSYSYMPNTYLRFGENPFSAVTLVDFESSGGGNMGPNLNNYVDLATRAGYLLIFSPLGPSFGSVFVNSIQTTISELFDGRHNLFAGLGVSTLSYPAESMRDHLAYKLALSKLDGNWIRLDNLFRNRVQRYNELKAAGQTTAVEPQIDETYLREMEILAEQEKIPFFRDIWSQLHPEVQASPTSAPVRKPIATTFLDAFVDQIDASFWQGKIASDVKHLQPLDGESLKTATEVTEAVRGGEIVLNGALENLDRLLSSEPESLFNVAWTSAEDLAETEWSEKHLKYWTVRGGPHPVRNRAFLYQVRREILDRLARLDPKQVRKELFMLSSGLVAGYNDKNASGGPNKEPTQRANSEIFEIAEREAKGGGGLLSSFGGLMSGSKRATFVDNYVTYYATSLSKLRAFADATLRKSVLEMLLRKVEALLKTYVGLFGKIEVIGRATRASIQTEEELYSTNSGGADGMVRVYADKACRAAAWERIEAQTLSSGSTAEVNRALTMAIHDAQRQSDEKRIEVSFNDLGDLFRRHVIDGYARRTITENHASEWNITVIEALRREAGVLRIEDWKTYLAEKIRLVSAQAEPYISLSPDTAGHMLKFWALHPDSEADVGSKDEFTRLTTGEQGEGSLVETTFSRHELYCVNFRLNLTLDQLSKLSDGDDDQRSINAIPPGDYQLAYNKRIEAKIEAEMRGNQGARVLSPHTHRDWHRPGALPEITPAKRKKIRDASIKSAAVALFFDLFQKLVLDNRNTTKFTTLNRLSGKLLPVDRDVVPSHDLFTVVNSFVGMTDLVRISERFWALSKEAAVSGRSAGPNLLDALLSSGKMQEIIEIASDRSRPAAVDAMVVELVSAWCHLVDEAVAVLHRDLSYQARKDLVQEKTSAVRAEVMAVLATRAKKDLARQYEVNFDMARDAVLSAI